MRLLAAAVACMVLSGFAGGTASAKQCRDAHGKFVKCATVTAAPKKCRDAKGKFIKCTAKKT